MPIILKNLDIYTYPCSSHSFFNLGARWRWVVNTTPWYPLYRRLGRPQGRSGRVLKISPPPGFDPRTIQLVASRYTDWAIPAHNEHNMNVLLFCCWLWCCF
jgi:hypothetical protein